MQALTAALRLAPVLLLAAGCGPEAKPVDRVLHLDPRLADGRSPALVLTGGAQPVSTRFDLGGREPWTLVDEPGRRVLRLAGPFAADEYASIELFAEGSGEAEFYATWSADGAPQEVRGACRPSPRPSTLAVRFDKAPGWTGEITELVLRFDPKTAFRILGASLLATGFSPGWEPLEESGDAGLIALGLEAHRAWPSDLGVPLFARATVPAGGRFEARVGSLSGAPARFTVSARRPSGGESAWELLGETTAKSVWTPMSVDLSAHAGHELELRLLAVGPRAEIAKTAEAPVEAGVLWGEPMITGERPAVRRPNIVLITLDTTRGDVLGQGFTPNLEKLAARGSRFDQAFATTNSTVPSHASIFTGLPTIEHGAIGNRHAFGVQNSTAAERLRAIGYHTSAAVSVSLLRPGFGFGQGFDRYELPRTNAFRDGAPAAAAAERWLAERGADQAPFFLWLHLFDPHTPYGPPQEFADAYIREHGLVRPPREIEPATMPIWDEPPVQIAFAREASNLEWMRFEYLLSVAYADFLVGRLLQGLEDSGLTETTLVVVTADHGESFGEREFWFEHANIYPEVIHVPLILAGPGVPAGVRVDQRVSTIDILPTLLRAAGRPDASLAGLDLLALAAGEKHPERRLWFQLSDGRQAGFRERETHFVTTLGDGLQWIGGAVVNDEGKRVPLFVGEPRGTHHLFDLLRDPEAMTDLADAAPERCELAAAEVKEWLSTRIRARSERRALSVEEERQLRALGYLDFEDQ